MKSLKDLIDKKLENKEDAQSYITREFQDYGYRLAEQLGDLKHKGFYIKLAKQEDRGLLEEALTFAKAYYSAKSKAKIFVWKLQQLKNPSS